MTEELTMQKGLLIAFSAEGSCADNAEGAGPDPTKSFRIRSKYT